MSGQEGRGGIAVLFKHIIWNQVFEVHRLRDQVWFRLGNMPDFRFGAVYIPPRDSPYFSQDSFAQIHQMINLDNDPAIILGDFNARIQNLDVFADEQSGITYSRNIDNGSNQNGRDLICAYLQI